MSFLADLLTDLLINAGVSSATSSRKRLPYIILGTISIIISGLALLLCFYLLKPVPIEKYVTTTITYTKCYATGSKDSRNIILENADKKYMLTHYLWPKNYDENRIVDLLRQSEQATIWLETGDALTLKGLSTTSFKIDPSVGWKDDKRTQNIWFGLTGMFFTLGVVIILAVWFDKSYT